MESYPPTGGARIQDGGVPANININNHHHQHIQIPARRSKAIRTWTLCTPTQGTHLHQLDLAAAMVRIAKDLVLVNPDARMETPGTSSWGGSCLPLRLWRPRLHRQMQHLLRPLRILLPTKGEALTRTLLCVPIHTTRYNNKVHWSIDCTCDVWYGIAWYSITVKHMFITHGIIMIRSPKLLCATEASHKMSSIK